MVHTTFAQERDPYIEVPDSNRSINRMDKNNYPQVRNHDQTPRADFELRIAISQITTEVRP